MTTTAVVVLAIFFIAMGLLASNRVRIDLIGLLVLAMLGLTNTVPPAVLYCGFSSDAVILIAGMLAFGEALTASGATARLGGWLERMGGGGSPQSLGYHCDGRCLGALGVHE